VPAQGVCSSRASSITAILDPRRCGDPWRSPTRVLACDATGNAGFDIAHLAFQAAHLTFRLAQNRAPDQALAVEHALVGKLRCHLDEFFLERLVPLAKSIDTITLDSGEKVNAIAMKQVLTIDPASGAKVIGKWSDGAAAVTTREVGKGKAEKKTQAVLGNAVAAGNSLTGLEKIEYDRYFDEVESRVRSQHVASRPSQRWDTKPTSRSATWLPTIARRRRRRRRKQPHVRAVRCAPS